MPGEATDPRDALILALDLPDAAAAFSLLGRLGEDCRWVKVGMELFYAEGPSLLREIRQRGYRIFLDLKLHDIPNTVASAVRTLSRVEADLLTLHTLGGSEMMAAAGRSAASEPTAPLLLGVTVLTSMQDSSLRQIGMEDTASELVRRLARLGMESGLAGLVASPLEVAALRAELGPKPLLVVPGVRPLGVAADDQSRTATPRATMAAGASMLVIGRPVTRAKDAAEAHRGVLEAMAAGYRDRNDVLSSLKA